MKLLLVLLATILVALCGAVTIIDKGKSNQQMKSETVTFIFAIIVTIATTYFVSKP